MKVAVIGSGPAAVGVLTALADRCPHARVTMFDPGDDIAPPDGNESKPSLYSRIRKRFGLTFPPPKTYFSDVPDKAAVDGKPRVWRARHFGGLSPFWGGVVLPYSDRELADWPISAADLAPHYRRMAEVMGVAGEPDGLNDYFGETFENRPAPKTGRVVRKLVRVCEQTPEMVAGTARLALETRSGQDSACTMCGRCMAGCPVGAIYETSNDVRRFLTAFNEGMLVKERVLRFDPKTRAVETDGDWTGQPFDRIYVAAGCLGSTEIVMRSHAIVDGPVMTDNTIFTFPIVYLGRTSRERGDGHSAMTQAIIGCLPRTGDRPFMKVQVYASFDYLWQYLLPAWLWPLFKPVGRMLRHRLFWARAYMDGTQSDQYPMRLGRGLELKSRSGGDATGSVQGVLSALRSALKGSGFMVPRLRPIRHQTSSHYTGTLPYGGTLQTVAGAVTIDRTGAVAPGVHVCDGSVFCSAPSNSPTFTIMANAHRTVMESCHD